MAAAVSKWWLSFVIAMPLPILQILCRCFFLKKKLQLHPSFSIVVFQLWMEQMYFCLIISLSALLVMWNLSLSYHHHHTTTTVLNVSFIGPNRLGLNEARLSSHALQLIFRIGMRLCTVMLHIGMHLQMCPSSKKALLWVLPMCWNRS